MSRILSRLAALVLLLAVGLLPARAQAVVTIKLATLAPEGSTWHKALAKMAEEWSTLSNGEVELKIYAGGVAGNETVMLRKMRIGQLHAGAFTNIGLMELDPSSQVLNTPMLIKDYEELDFVMSRMQPTFESRIDASGYKVLAWSDVGWAHLFSKTPIVDPDDRGKLKIFAWEGDPAAVEMYQRAGFKPVVVAATDVVPSLQSGLIDSFPSTPLGALALQWFGIAPNMLDVPWAPLLGATIITKDAWASIPAQYHAALQESASRNGAEIKDAVRKQDKKAVEVMQRYGLVVNHADQAAAAEWEAVAKETWPVVREKMVSPEIFDEVKGLVEEHRAATP
jgi:TRAP-type C4-dicarboxylate transport system substrate-binding protein